MSGATVTQSAIPLPQKGAASGVASLGSDSLVTPSQRAATYGTISARPSAATAGDRAFYFATDDNGGTLYQVQSAAWVTVASKLAGTVNTVAAKVLIQPSSDTENGITIKRPSSTYGSGTYGTGQALEVLKDAALPTDLGYVGVPLTDLVIARLTGEGSLGLGGNLHLATGLRQPQGYATSFALKVEPYVDTRHLQLIAYSGQTLPVIDLFDSGAVERFKLASSGNITTGMTSAGKGGVLGDLGSGGAGYFGFAHSDNVATTNYALAQGANGDTLVNAKTGQTVTLRVNNAAVVTVSATIATIAAELKHTGTKVGFFNATTATKPTVTGAKGGNAALGSLLSALSTLGLVTDSSTA